MKILAFAGSNSSSSINKQLIAYTAGRLSSTHEIEILDLNHYEMPLYSSDREKQSGIPSLALDFAKKIDDSDMIVISLAEHNGSYSVAFKNIFDWISRIPQRSAWGKKNMILMSTSPGERGGSTTLEVAKNRFPFNGGNVLATFSLPSFSKNFDPQKGILDEHLKQLFEQTLQSIA